MDTVTTHIETEKRSTEPSRTKLVPALRFKDFEGVCSERIFSELVKVIDCKHRTPPYVEVGIPLVSPGTIKWGEIDLISPTKRVSETEYESLMDHCSPTIGDLVFSRNQSIGVASYLKKEEKFVLGQDTVLIQSKEIDPGYNYYRLQTYSVQCLIDRLSGGSTFARINLSDLRKLKIIVVKNQREQQKIASFLSAVDEKIQQLSKKKVLLEQYKKGVMQQLFSGQLRFKDQNGKDYPVWQEKQLGEIAIFKRGKNILASEKGHNYLLGMGAVAETGKLLLNKKTDYNDDFLMQNDLVMPERDIGIGLIIGRVARIDESNKYILGANILSLTMNEFCISDYIYYQINEQRFRKKMNRLVNGSAQLMITSKEVKTLKVNLPFIEEQQKIASYLSNIDTKIESVSNQISQAQSFKKGLLQHMFV